MQTPNNFVASPSGGYGKAEDLNPAGALNANELKILEAGRLACVSDLAQMISKILLDHFISDKWHERRLYVGKFRDRSVRSARRQMERSERSI